MSKKGFNQFKSFASDNLGGSGKNLKFQLPLIAGTLLLWFAGQSIYYGNHFLNPSHSFYYSSIKRRIIMLTTSNVPKYAYLRKVAVLPMLAFLLPDTEKAITLNSLSSKFPLFIMSKPEKIKSELKLPIEICNLSSSQ